MKMNNSSLIAQIKDRITQIFIINLWNHFEIRVISKIKFYKEVSSIG